MAHISDRDIIAALNGEGTRAERRHARSVVDALEGRARTEDRIRSGRIVEALTVDAPGTGSASDVDPKHAEVLDAFEDLRDAITTAAKALDDDAAAALTDAVEQFESDLNDVFDGDSDKDQGGASAAKVDATEAAAVTRQYVRSPATQGGVIQ